MGLLGPTLAEAPQDHNGSGIKIPSDQDRNGLAQRGWRRP